MFARLVTMKLKANSAEEFSRLIDNEILPLLRKQKGFRDEITFISRERHLHGSHLVTRAEEID